MFKIVTTLILILFCISISYSIQTISSCPYTINSGNMPVDRTYEVSQNLSSSGQCIEIDDNNLTLDCNNHTITGDRLGIGIYTIFQQDITIRNCKITNFTHGISIEGSTSLNYIIENITSYNNNISGINIGAGANANIKNLILFNNLANGFGSAFSNLKLNNVLSYNNSGNGIILRTNSENLSLENLNSYNNSEHGFAFYYTNNVSFNTSSSLNNTENGYYFSHNNNIILNNLNSYGNNASGFSFYGGSNLSAKNLNSTLSGSYGIYLTPGASNNNYFFNNLKIRNNSGFGMRISSVNNITFTNSIFEYNNIYEIDDFGGVNNLTFYNNYFQSSSRIDGFTSPSNHFFYKFIPGIGNIGNLYGDLNCLSSTIISNYEICNNPSNITISGSGVYDIGPIVSNNAQIQTNTNSLFPIQSLLNFLFSSFILIYFFIN